MRHRLWFSLVGLFLAGLAPYASADEPGEIRFSRDIRPILAEHCFACHGPDQEKRESGLRLDDRAAAIGKAESGEPAIVPGKPDASTLVHRITTTEADERMPPESTGKKLKPEQIDLLKRWIAQGASYQGHWAFQPPTRPALPPIPRQAAPSICRYRS